MCWKAILVSNKGFYLFEATKYSKKKKYIEIGLCKLFVHCGGIIIMEVSVIMLLLIWWLHSINYLYFKNVSEYRIDEMNNNIFGEHIEADIWSHKNIHHTSILMKLEIRHMPKAIQKYRKIIFKDRKKYGFYICNFSKNTIHPMCVCLFCSLNIYLAPHLVWMVTHIWLLTFKYADDRFA